MPALAKTHSETPRTDSARFRITSLDVGSEAVRLGHMAELEHEHYVLITAAKLALHRLQNSGDAVAVFALQAAIKATGER